MSKKPPDPPESEGWSLEPGGGTLPLKRFRLRRAIAFIIDLSIASVLWDVIDNLLATPLPFFIPPLGKAAVFVLYFSFIFLGKRLLKLRVVSPRGESVTIEQRLGRHAILAAMVSVSLVDLISPSLLQHLPWLVHAMLVGIPIGLLIYNVGLVIFDPQGRGLHDRVAKTRLVRHPVREGLYPVTTTGLPKPALAGFLILLSFLVYAGFNWFISTPRPGFLELMVFKQQDVISITSGINQVVASDIGIRIDSEIRSSRSHFEVKVWIPYVRWEDRRRIQEVILRGFQVSPSRYSRADLRVWTGGNPGYQVTELIPLTVTASGVLVMGDAASESRWDKYTRAGREAYEQGRYTEAEEMVLVALKEAKSFGAQDARLATSVNDLAVLFQAQERYEEAEPLHRRALEVREKTLGPEHPDVALSLNNLAMLYQVQRRYEAAEPLHRRALEVRNKVLGPDHLDVAQSLNNLGALYYKQGKYTDAEALHRQALEVREKVLGPEHPDVAVSLQNLAMLYQRQGKYAEAETHYKKALEVLETALGPEHPSVVTLLKSYALLLRHADRHTEADAMWVRIKAIQAKTED